MAIILEKTDSAYYPCFRTLFGNVVSSLAEAKEISLYLTPLTKCFKAVEEVDFAEAKPVMVTLIHSVGLAWAGTKYYQSSSKVIIMFRQICNLLIQEARRFLDPTLIFQSDVDEALQRVQVSKGKFIGVTKKQSALTCFQIRQTLWRSSKGSSSGTGTSLLCGKTCRPGPSTRVQFSVD